MRDLEDGGVARRGCVKRVVTANQVERCRRRNGNACRFGSCTARWVISCLREKFGRKRIAANHNTVVSSITAMFSGSCNGVMTVMQKPKVWIRDLI